MAAARARQRRELATHVAALETEIAAIEARERALVAELEAPATHAARGRVVKINRELADLHARLAGLHAA